MSSLLWRSSPSPPPHSCVPYVLSERLCRSARFGQVSFCASPLQQRTLTWPHMARIGYGPVPQLIIMYAAEFIIITHTHTMYIHTYIHTHTMYIHTYTHTCTYIYTQCTYTHTYTHTHTHMYIHTHTCTHTNLLVNIHKK